MQERHSRCISAVLLVVFFAANAYSLDTARPVNPWMQVAKLTASADQGGEFVGTSVAIDGDTVVVGYPYVYTGSGAGEALVFVKPKKGWTNLTQTAILVPSDGKYGEYFGGAVATPRPRGFIHRTHKKDLHRVTSFPQLIGLARVQ